MTGTRVRNDFRRQCCPACGKSSIAEVGKVPMFEQMQYSTHAIALERVPEIWACGTCASWFTQNAVPPEISRQLYASGSSGARWSAEPFDKAKESGLLAEFDRHVSAGARVLDIGCSTGQLLDYAKSRGAETWGTDFSEDCGHLARSKGHRFGASMTEFESLKFDVVTAFDLIEHVYDLPGFLSQVADLLQPQGRFLVLTGDVGCLSARICGSRWWYVRYPEHIVFPSRRFLAGLTTGFQLKCVVRTYASVGYRTAFLPALRAAVSLGVRARYEGLPSLGPDHLLAVLQRE